MDSKENAKTVEAACILNHPEGLHARPAALFVEIAQSFTSAITVQLGESQADGKSILSVLTLGADQGAYVTIRAEGIDAEEAIESLTRLIEQLDSETDENEEN
jgi:phosphotransferase system HPr (HPr) family protein